MPLASQLLPSLPESLCPAVTLANWLLPTRPLPMTQGGILGHPPWTGAEPGHPLAHTRGVLGRPPWRLERNGLRCP